MALAALLIPGSSAGAARSLQQTVDASLIQNALAAYQSNPQGTINAIAAREYHLQIACSSFGKLCWCMGLVCLCGVLWPGAIHAHDICYSGMHGH